MSSNSTADDPCTPDDTLCRVREHQQAVIIVPTLLLFGSLVLILALFLLRYCPKRTRTRVTAPQSYNPSSHRHTQRHRHSHSHRRHLQGIDAPPGLNPLEHEELPMSVHQVQKNVKPIPVALHQTSTERHLEAFSQVTALPAFFPIKHDNAVSLYRARMDNRDVVLRVLKDTANSSEKQHFLGFASFVSGLGPHPFIPTVMGVISVQSPLMMVVEELQHRDLLGFLWKCREDNSGLESPYEITEQRIFTMARQVASALDYLHSQNCIHGNMGARSVLVGSNLTVKLWGFGTAYRRTRTNSSEEVEVMELKKWQAPEVLARRGASQSSDVWSFGILLYEMATLGDAPFSELMATELLQYLQRGKHLRRPAACSKSLYDIIRSCCQFNSQQRPSTSGLIRQLQAGEISANGRTVLRAPEPINIERYIREAGYGEAYNYAVL